MERVHEWYAVVKIPPNSKEPAPGSCCTSSELAPRQMLNRRPSQRPVPHKPQARGTLRTSAAARSQHARFGSKAWLRQAARRPSAALPPQRLSRAFVAARRPASSLTCAQQRYLLTRAACAPRARAAMSHFSGTGPSVAIRDGFEALEEVRAALRRAGLEKAALVLGVDYTKSNEWTGAVSYEGRCLHAVDEQLRTRRT